MCGVSLDDFLAETEEQVVVLDGLDGCVLGYVEVNEETKLVYSYDLLVKHFTQEFSADSDDPEGDAIEWVNFNIVGAYYGMGTPVILYETEKA